jgi:cell division protein FtsI/penicillin-binding protein 2
VTLLQLAAAYGTLARRLAAGESEVDREISDGLRRAVHAENGSARLAAIDGVEVAGKTGTAEAARSGKENGWFVGWAPATGPEIVVAVAALESESGGKSAAPIAGRILRALKRGKAQN